MRLLCLLFLAVFVAAVGLFIYQNHQEVTLTLFDWSVTASAAVVIGVSYLLGMLSGWSVVGALRRSLNRTTAWAEHHQAGR